MIRITQIPGIRVGTPKRNVLVFLAYLFGLLVLASLAGSVVGP